MKKMQLISILLALIFAVSAFCSHDNGEAKELIQGWIHYELGGGNANVYQNTDRDGIAVESGHSYSILFNTFNNIIMHDGIITFYITDTDNYSLNNAKTALLIHAEKYYSDRFHAGQIEIEIIDHSFYNMQPIYINNLKMLREKGRIIDEKKISVHLKNPDTRFYGEFYHHDKLAAKELTEEIVNATPNGLIFTSNMGKNFNNLIAKHYNLNKNYVEINLPYSVDYILPSGLMVKTHGENIMFHFFNKQQIDAINN